MHPFDKLIKPLLALLLSGAVLAGLGANAAEKPAKDKKHAARTVQMTVTEKGYEPSPLKVKKGEPLKLVVTRKTEQTCATELVLPDYQIAKELPLNQPVEISFTPEKSGELKYGCAMGMMINGVLVVE